MSNAQLFLEAVDTMLTLGRALIGWLIFLATVATMLTLGRALIGWLIFLATVATILVLAAIATGAWGVNVLRRRAATPSWARSRRIGRRLARRSRDYEEAA